MISSLKGKIERIGFFSCDVEVNGVGYLVNVSNSFGSKHSVGEEIKINIHMAVSENDISLFGFEAREDIDLFKMLITVSGIGSKTAARIIWESKTESVIKAISDADVKFFEKIKGIGKKSAQRIIIDLKSKIGGLGEIDLSQNDELLEDDLYLSLRQLGFEKKEIEEVTKKMPSDLLDLQTKLTWSLKNIK